MSSLSLPRIPLLHHCVLYIQCSPARVLGGRTHSLKHFGCVVALIVIELFMTHYFNGKWLLHILEDNRKKRQILWQKGVRNSVTVHQLTNNLSLLCVNCSQWTLSSSIDVKFFKIKWIRIKQMQAPHGSSEYNSKKTQVVKKFEPHLWGPSWCNWWRVRGWKDPKKNLIRWC